jgi:hypothetical protein
MRRKPLRVTQTQALRPEVGQVYWITNYHTGDFVGTCIEQLFQTARYRVNAPLASALSPGDEIEIAYRSPANIVPVCVSEGDTKVPHAGLVCASW